MQASKTNYKQIFSSVSLPGMSFPGNLCEYLHGINVHKKDEEINTGATPEIYYMLNDTSAEDKAIRYKIYSDKLDRVLKQQQASDDFTNFSLVKTKIFEISFILNNTISW